MIFRQTILLFAVCFSLLFPQEQKLIQQIKNAFEDFEYAQVIALSDSLLKSYPQITLTDKNDILLLKAVSHYSLSEEQQARKCFIDMLAGDRTLQLDENRVSPKILALFTAVREEYLAFIPVQPENTVTKKDISEAGITSLLQQYSRYNAAVYKSLLLPGWGHYSLGESAHGIILGSAALLTMGAAIYYQTDVSDKETAYLSAIEPAEIESGYSAYNRSYKIRNMLIAGFAAIWLYAQGDLLIRNSDFTGGIGLLTVSNGTDDRIIPAMWFRYSLF
ncbi:MAG: hypothetical protein L6Q47_04745 [Ignavibacteriaceae bacterium]|nr:hypothetical protein [Ignavibacteriaceae bacterium]